MGRRKYSQEQLDRMTAHVYETATDLVLRATAEQREAGIGWYAVAHEEAQLLAHEYDFDVVTAASIIAVLSPLTRWAGNLEDAWAVCAGEKARHALPRNVRKVERILAGERPADVVGGKKVASFALNIAHPLDLDGVVTLDSWMGRAFGIDPADIFGIAGVYEAVSIGIRHVARDMLLRAHQVQAIVWLVTIAQHERGRDYGNELEVF